MEKEERIKRYGEAAYDKMLQQQRDWHAQYREECNVVSQAWREANPEKAKAHHQESGRKGGKRYRKKLVYQRTGIPGERNRIRLKHTRLYRTIKEAIPNSVFHHEWIPGSAKYRGVALVDKEAHLYGIINVIKVMEGKITLFTEKEIREQGREIK